MKKLLIPLAATTISACSEPEIQPIPVETPIKVLIIDGQNNHPWRKTTVVLAEALREEGNFTVDISTTPGKSAKGQPTSPTDPKWADWNPPLTSYDVIVSNYNGELWPEPIRENFHAFVQEGGGFVSVHAADNAFPTWAAYNEMIGVGGWEGRTRGENGAVWLTVENGQVIRDTETKGPGGGHGPREEFLIHHLDSQHPILADLPTSWLHTQDELYCHLCGPAKNLEVLGHSASARSGRNEPMLMTITYGKGRIFHTTLGHDVTAMRCRGFYETLQRGTEWAATGDVARTAEVPLDFPTSEQTSPVPAP